ncbi:beta-ketoacyl synthase N-terminal-like domain-containing protein [Nonomuraea longicatena]|uniref:Beta-ketoacyl-[acyl-carrier-protein] synthase family protein n=1 Tax=Nonomuraea longicatena TaxID=83682 RepID=A0ABP4AI70_9ACTN
MDERVYVTGLGMISPAGAGTAPFWADLCAARGRFEELTPLYAGMKPGVLAARVPQAARERALAEVGPASAGTRHPASLFAEYAALEALADAGLTPGEPVLRDAVVCVGTNDGQAAALENLVAGRCGIEEAAGLSSHTLAEGLARAAGSHGPAFTVHNTCASANVALACALDMLRAGVAATAIVGGCDAYSEKNIIGFSSLQALGPAACRPFSRDRRYVTPSEGAGILVLSTAAALGGRRPYAEVKAVAVTNDARHPTAPDPDGVAACHRLALEQAGVGADEIGAVFAHGTGSRANDAIEGAIFAERYPKAAVTAIKGTIGHLMGAAGAAGAVAACLALRHGLVPPTRVEADEVELGLDLVTGAPRAVEGLRYVQNNAFGFGGHNAIAVFGAVDE